MGLFVNISQEAQQPRSVCLLVLIHQVMLQLCTHTTHAMLLRLTCDFACLWGYCTHDIWPRSTPTAISRHKKGFSLSYCLDVIVRPSDGILMWCLQMQHVSCCRGMQGKTKERQFNSWSDAANDLKHTYTWCHECWDVLDVYCCLLLCWMFDWARLRTNFRISG